MCIPSCNHHYLHILIKYVHDLHFCCWISDNYTDRLLIFTLQEAIYDYGASKDSFLCSFLFRSFRFWLSYKGLPLYNQHAHVGMQTSICTNQTWAFITAGSLVWEPHNHWYFLFIFFFFTVSVAESKLIPPNYTFLKAQKSQCPSFIFLNREFVSAFPQRPAGNIENKYFTIQWATCNSLPQQAFYFGGGSDICLKVGGLVET